MILAPIFLTEINGLPPLGVGAVLFPGAVAIATLSSKAGDWADRAGPRAPVFAGLVAMIAGGVVTALFAGGSPWGVGAGLTLFGVGFAFTQSPLVSTVNRIIPRGQGGGGVGVFMMIFFVGGAAGVAASVTAIELQPDELDSVLGLVSAPGGRFANAILGLTAINLAGLALCARLPGDPRRAPGRRLSLHFAGRLPTFERDPRDAVFDSELTMPRPFARCAIALTMTSLLGCDAGSGNEGIDPIEGTPEYENSRPGPPPGTGGQSGGGSDDEDMGGPGQTPEMGPGPDADPSVDAGPDPQEDMGPRGPVDLDELLEEERAALGVPALAALVFDADGAVALGAVGTRRAGEQAPGDRPGRLAPGLVHQGDDGDAGRPARRG